jgi:hypothetical protein
MPRLTGKHRTIWFTDTNEVLTEIDDDNPRSITEYERIGLSHDTSDTLAELNTEMDRVKVFRRRESDDKLVNSKGELVNKDGATVDEDGQITVGEMEIG